MAEQKQKKGKEKTQDDQEQPDVPPNPFHPAKVPGNFLGKISSPDDQKLRELQIGPEHHKGQKDTSQVLELGWPYYLREGFPVGKPGQDGDRKRHRGKRLRYHKQQSVNRGVPLRLQRHDPVDARKRNGKSVQNQSNPAQSFQAHPKRKTRLARVLLPGPLVQEKREREPDCEIENHAGDEKFRIQIGLLRKNDRIGLTRARPNVNRPHSREKR